MDSSLHRRLEEGSRRKSKRSLFQLLQIKRRRKSRQLSCMEQQLKMQSLIPKQQSLQALSTRAENLRRRRRSNIQRVGKRRGERTKRLMRMKKSQSRHSHRPKQKMRRRLREKIVHNRKVMQRKLFIAKSALCLQSTACMTRKTSVNARIG
jgi:hypothetical protein